MVVLEIFKKIKFFTGIFIYHLLGWLIAAPLAYIVPKKKKLVIFVGREKGLFIDNVKYLFLHAAKLKEQNIELYFLATNKKNFDELREKNLPAIRYPIGIDVFINPISLFRSIVTILRASVVVIDDGFWVRKFRYHLLLNSKKIQLWHGIPLKKIGKQVIKHNFINLLSGYLAYYDLLISTSKYITESAFSKAFDYDTILESGYPRNDVLHKHETDLILLGTDKSNISSIKELKNKGHKIILYAPTFRDTGGDAIHDNVLDTEALSKFAVENELIFVFKFHAARKYEHEFKTMRNIIEYENHCDIYPLLPYTDLLITDYSSIYFDYLLLDKPVLFFPYDYKKYVEEDRELIFDYEQMTPGPKCYNQKEVHDSVLKILVEGIDEYAEKRRDILKLAFKHTDDKASERIWNFIRNTYLNP